MAPLECDRYRRGTHVAFLEKSCLGALLLAGSYTETGCVKLVHKHVYQACSSVALGVSQLSTLVISYLP